MQPSGKTEAQHYVPKFLLRAHAHNKPCDVGKEQIWCFDKNTERLFSPNLKGIASQNNFYKLDIDDIKFDLEPFLTYIESQASPIIKYIIDNKSLKRLTQKDRKILSRFLAVQLVRTQASKDELNSMVNGVSDALIKRGADTTMVEEMFNITDIERNLLSIKSIFNAPHDYEDAFYKKHWYLLSSQEEDPFYIGDNPLVRDNDFSSIKGNIGIISPGVNIYLPLSPTICLCMVDKKVIEDLVRDHRRAISGRIKTLKIMVQKNKIGRKQREEKEVQNNKSMIEIYKDLRPLFNSGLLPYSAKSTMRVNSLQVFFASRRIMSSLKDFSLANRIVSENERARHPPAYTVS